MNHGEHWSDLQINNAIIAQMLASRMSTSGIPTHGWEEEIMGCAGEVEGRMVTGEMAFLAAQLFTLESRRQINCVNERLEEALGMIEEMRTLITEHEETIGSLGQHVHILEGQGWMRRRRNQGSQTSQLSGGPSTSTRDSSYGSPILLAGMVGDGVVEPYQLVLAEPVPELEVVVREEPVTPVIPPVPLEEEEREVITTLDDEGEGLQAELDRNYAWWIADGGSPSGRSSSLEVQEVVPPLVREGEDPPPYCSLSPAPPNA